MESMPVTCFLFYRWMKISNKMLTVDSQLRNLLGFCVFWFGLVWLKFCAMGSETFEMHSFLGFFVCSCSLNARHCCVCCKASFECHNVWMNELQRNTNGIGCVFCVLILCSWNIFSLLVRYFHCSLNPWSPNPACASVCFPGLPCCPPTSPDPPLPKREKKQKMPFLQPLHSKSMRCAPQT